MLRYLVVACIVLFLPFTLTMAESDVILRGAGATFPYLLYTKWIDRYHAETKVRVSYAPVGSGAGIAQLVSHEVDFGGTDAFLTDEELRDMSGCILHLPTCVGAVAIVYNLPMDSVLRLTPELIADIFAGRITKWANREIAEANGNVSLPQMDITVVHRSEGSGTTFLFTDYLSKVSSQWREKIGSGKTVKWPSGLGLEGNPGVAEMVKQIPGSIGYVELSYAKSANLPTASVRNRSGKFIEPGRDTVSSAADVEIPPDARILITDTASPTGYPISGFSYIIFYKDLAYNQFTRRKAESLARFLSWIVHEGQQYNEQLHYGRLPHDAVRVAETIIGSITFGGKPVTARQERDRLP